MSALSAKRQPEGVSFCPECGASAVEGMTCWEQLGAVIAWEWQDPELQALHFLIVASYNLQHPAQFTDEAVAGLSLLYRDYLDNGLSTAVIRQRAANLVRGQKIVRKEEERRAARREWRMTVADVYCRGQAEGAAERARAWAAAIRKAL